MKNSFKKRDGKLFAITLPSRLPARVNGINNKTLEAGVTECWQIV